MFMVAHGSRVVLADDALSRLLDSFRGGPWLVYVAGGEVFQHRQISSDKVTIGISLPAELDWAVAVEKLLEKRGAREPHPGSSIDRPVGIQQELIKDSHAFLPGHPEVAPGEEAGGGVPRQVVDPALLPQLSHDGVNPGISGLGVGPFRQDFSVVIPGHLNININSPSSLSISNPYLHADGIPGHFIKVRISCSCTVEEFSPQQLSMEGQGWVTFLDLLVKI